MARCVLLVLIFGVTGAGAQSSDGGFALEPGTRRQLAALQESWVRWLSEIQQGHNANAASITQEIRSDAARLGMESLPELSKAASLLAVDFALRADFEAAETALTSARELAADEPEVAFAAASIARRQGRYIEAVREVANGGNRLARDTLKVRLVAGSALHWVLIALTAAALAYVIFQMAVHGPHLLRDLSGFFGRSLPALAAYLLALAAILWPVALPSGYLWLILYWSVLLLGYGSRGQRVAMVAAWLSLGIFPLAINQYGKQIDSVLSTPRRAMNAAAEGRLSGSLFVDIGLLREILPDSVAAKHFTADLHLRLGQWRRAAALYREVLISEPENEMAFAGLGTCYFLDGDLDNAYRYLERATSGVTTASPAAFYNLSRVLTEQYKFGEAEAALRKASNRNSELVGSWIAAGDALPAVVAGGGFDRRPEILRELEATRRTTELGVFDLLKRTMSVPLALVFVGPAVAVFVLARRSKKTAAESTGPWFSGHAEIARATALVGFPEAESRRWWRSVILALAAAALIAAQSVTTYGFKVPLSYRPPMGWIPMAALSVLGLLLLLRLIFTWRRLK